MQYATFPFSLDILDSFSREILKAPASYRNIQALL